MIYERFQTVSSFMISALPQLHHSLQAWMSLKELARLANRKSFARISPDRVAQTLQSISTQMLHRPSQDRSEGEIEKIREELLTVWEHAKGQLEQQNSLQFKWHRVMAFCNALYDQSFEELLLTAEDIAAMQG